MALVGLTGALMVGPAFAAPKGPGPKDVSGHDDMKHDICHFNADGDLVDDGTGTGTSELVDVDVWQFRNIDSKSLYKHLGDLKYKGHSDGSVDDFEILFETDNVEFGTDPNLGQFGVNDSAADCTGLGATP